MTLKSDFIIDETIRTPLYMQVYTALYQWIQQGRYQPGDKLESEAGLCKLFGVSRISVRRALEMLSNEGWIESRQGKGSFVTDRKPDLPFKAGMNERIHISDKYSKLSTTKQFMYGLVPADAKTAVDLGIDEGTDVIRVSYVREMKGVPMGYIESFFLADLGVDFTADDFKKATSLTVLANKGIAIAGIDNLFGAVLADARFSQLLQVHVGAPLVRTKMSLLDENNKPLARIRGFWRADKYEHHVYMARDAQTGAPKNISPNL